MNMNNFKSMCLEIEKQLPEFSNEVNCRQKEKERLLILSHISLFAEFTERAILSGNMTTVKKSFELAEKLYKEGDDMIKIGLEHIFLPHLHLQQNHRMYKEAKSMLPFCLLQSYYLLYEHNRIEK